MTNPETADPTAVPPPMSRAAKAEALLLRFTAEAHRRKWSYDRGLDDDGVPVPSDGFMALHRLGEDMRVALEELRRMPAAASVPPPATRADDRAALRDRITDTVTPFFANFSDEEAARANAGEVADAVLAVLFGSIPAGTDIATWTAIRAIQLMNEAGQQRDAALAVLPAPVDRAAEEHRLALSEALGLGTGAPWEAIHDRVTELGLPPLGRDPVARRLGLLAAYRATILTEAADAVFALDYDAMVGEEGDENLGSMREAWDLGTVHATLLLRRLADEAQQPVSGPCVAGEQQPESSPPCAHCKRLGHSFEDCPRADEPATTCTCGVAGDGFVPLGHYRDCPDAAGVRQDGAQP